MIHGLFIIFLLNKTDKIHQGQVRWSESMEGSKYRAASQLWFEMLQMKPDLNLFVNVLHGVKI